MMARRRVGLLASPSRFVLSRIVILSPFVLSLIILLSPNSCIQAFVPHKNSA
jgi:hypothetical protein